MSRIGRMPIPIPNGVEVKIQGSLLTVKGPKGSLIRSLHPDITVVQENGSIVCSRPTEQKEHRSLHGLTRALINNMVVGVTEGYERKMSVEGVGYRAEMRGDSLSLQVGYAHPVVVDPMDGITFETGVETNTRMSFVILRGNDKETVGQQAALIRRVRPPEPYKGKGIRFAGEVIRRKVGKAGAKGGKK